MSLFADVYSTDRSKAVVPVLVLLFVALWFILRGDLFYILPCVILFLCCFSPFSIAITSLGEASLSAFRTFVRFVLVCICQFHLPLGVWERLRFVIVALPGLFSYTFFEMVLLQVQRSWKWHCMVYQFSHARQHELLKNVPSEIALSANRII